MGGETQMSITEAITTVPTGTWKADPIHSSLGFAVRHMGVTPFRGGFADFQAALVDGRLSGTARVESISTEDETLTGHLFSPDFFDAERHPELRFDSTEIHREGDDVTITGELTLKGTTGPVELHGTIAGPITDPYGGSRVGLTLSGTIDRTQFGIDWNNELPSGGNILGDDVKLTAELELAREL
jgi:polyisoprenoid-binding protein YceI